MRPKSNPTGARNAKSAKDGISLRMKGDVRASISLRHPGISDRLKSFESPDAVVERAEIHVVDLEGDTRALRIGQGHANDGSLAMNAFLPEPMVGRQFHFDGDDLTECRSG